MPPDPFFLYVEDDPTSREVMEMTLVYRMGYDRYAVLEDSTEFLNKLRALPHRPDLIFLDIHMLPHSGFEVLKMVRGQTDYDQTRVIALTASVMNEEVAALEQAGFDGAIAKPIDPDIFPELVHRILAGENIWHIA